MMRQRGESRVGLILILGLMAEVVAALLLILVLLPAPASAAVTCPGATSVDSDGDGLSDAAECSGFSLPPALGTTSFPSCRSLVAPFDRTTCVDPDSKDVFIIVVPAATGFLPSNLLQLLSGLPVGVHVITQTPAQVLANPDRTVNGTQKAIRLSESLDTNGSTAGQCNWGTPNDAAECVVFTQRIVNFVNSTFATCTPGASLAAIQSIITTYIQQVAAHEPSHSMKLTKIYDAKYGGHHYAPGTSAMMAQNNTYSCKGGKLTWTIGTPFTAADLGDFLLK